MQHSVKSIAENYSDLSNRRKDIERFDYDSFIEFAKNNKDKYSLVNNGDDLLVSTWHSTDLINDYRKTLKKGS